MAEDRASGARRTLLGVVPGDSDTVLAVITISQDTDVAEDGTPCTKAHVNIYDVGLLQVIIATLMNVVDQLAIDGGWLESEAQPSNLND